ncbi:MAG: AMP-binding protein [Gammaproteobacteria bacterium]
MVEAESLRDLMKIIEQKISSKPIKIQPQPFSPILEMTSLDLTNARTLIDVLMTYATKEPNRPHLYLQNEMGEEQVIHYGQLFEEAKKIARGIYKQGIQPGETIGIMLPTSEDFFYAFCGILLAGAIPVPIYPPYRPDRIEEYAKREAKILQNAQARLLITFSQAEALSNILRIFIPSLKGVTTVKNLQLLEGPLQEISIESSDPALIQYTSGSTGDPKGVLLTHENMLANIRAIIHAIPAKPTDVEVSWLPLYHDMGLMSWLGSLYLGIPITILSPLTFLTRPERWLWAIHYHRGTLSGGPNFAYELCVKKINPEDIEGLDLSSWRFAFNGAEAINPKTLERFSKKFSRYGFRAEAFAPVYGLAEATVGLTFPTKSRAPRVDKIQRDIFEKEGKAIPSASEKNILEFVGCGEPLLDHKIRIVDNAGQVLEDRVVGNLQFKGPSAMQGYFNNPEATQKAYHDGWWDTGDLGYRSDNEIFVTGRKKDLIIKAGRHLYPEEAEDIVSQIPSIRKGCVIAFGVSDPDSGTEKLIIVAETYELDKKKQQSIRSDVIEKMGIQIGIPPDTVILVPPRTIPKTSSGKLQRSECKKSYLEGKLFKQQLPARMQFAKLAFIAASKKVWSWLAYFGKFLYALYVGIILLITTPFIWLSILSLPRQYAARIIQIWARNFFRLIGCPITLEGKTNLQNTSPIIYVSNHSSYTDSILLLGILPPGVLFTVKKELLTTPIIKTFIKKLGYVTVDRMDFIKSLENKKSIEESISKKQSIVIFPEGTFTYATGLRPFKLGAFTVAAETGTPICPIAIRGTRSILRGDTYLPKPGAINITIGKPIYPKSKDWNEILRLHSLVRSEIATHCGEPVIDVIVAGPVLD